MNKPSVGVNTPESGNFGADEEVAVSVGVALDLAVAVTVGVEVGVDVDVEVAVGFAVAVCVGVAEGVDSKAGPSAAETTKVLVIVRSIPFASFHFIVKVC